MLRKVPKPYWIRFGIALTVFIVAFAVICGAWRNSNTPKLFSPEEALAFYNESTTALQAQEVLYYKVTGCITATINGNAIEENITQYVTVESPLSETPTICVEEVRTIGQHSIKLFNYFFEEQQLLAIQNTGFQASITKDDFLQKFVPALMIAPALYTDILGVQVGNDITLSFNEPVGLETWVANGVQLTSAEGRVQLNDDLKLSTLTYTAGYNSSGIDYTVHYTVEIMNDSATPVNLPDASGFTELSNIDAPYLLEKACGYLTSASNVRSEYTDNINCEAFGDDRSQTIALYIESTDSWSAQVDTSVVVSNSSKAGATTSTKTEVFKDNAYSVSTNNGIPAENPDVDQSTMSTYCQNLLIGTLLLPQDITTAEINVTNNICSISFQANENFAHILAEEACTTLYQSPSVLTDLASSYTTESITCYLNINILTGFPVSSGFNYKGTYTISDLPYSLSFKADQTYTLPSDITSEEMVETTE